MTIVKLTVAPSTVTSLEVEKLEPVTVTVPPLNGKAAGETELMIGTNGKVITGFDCQFTESESTPANLTTTAKL